VANVSYKSFHQKWLLSINRRLFRQSAHVRHCIHSLDSSAEVETSLCDRPASTSSAVLYPEMEITVH